jgi:hypothetical protein
MKGWESATSRAAVVTGARVPAPVTGQSKMVVRRQRRRLAALEPR